MLNKIILFLLSFLFYFSIHANQPLASDPKYFWMDEAIESQFSAYEESGITEKMIEMTEKTQPQNCKWKRYKVINSVIFGPSGAVKEMLEYLVNHYNVPDVDFVYLDGDGLIESHEHIIEYFPGPGLVSAKSKNAKNTILFHEHYFFMESSGNWPHYNWKVIKPQITQISSLIKWEDKKPQAFWRGNKTGPYFWHQRNWKELARTKICYLSYLYPYILNAGLCHVPHDLQFIKDIEGIDVFKSYASLEEHLHYKYQICLDGHTSTYPGYQWRLYSRCCTFKQETQNIQWFYTQLKPWVHYIPVEEDLSDLIEKIQWALMNDETSKNIAQNAYSFVEENLMDEHIALYCYKVLVKYASLQNFSPSIKRTDKIRGRK